MRLGWARVLAWVVDWLTILAWAGVVAAVGVPLYRAGVTDDVGVFALNVIGGLLLVVPVTLALAGQEGGRRQATVGKRMLKLRVTSDAGAVGFSRALLRNILKIALPWLLGHAAAFELATTAGGPGVIALTICAYALPIGYFASLFLAAGRTPYDRLTQTSVTMNER